MIAPVIDLIRNQLRSSLLGVCCLASALVSTPARAAVANSDLIWSNSVTGERAIWLMNGTAFFGSSTLGLFPLEWTIAGTSDFNADGKPDLVWSNSLTHERALWLMDGTRFLGASTLGIFPAEWTVVATGDFNFDAKPDIVWSNSLTGERALWLMNGTDRLGVSTLGIFPKEWTVVGTGDFNFDGKTDIVWSNSLTGERALWLMNGTNFLAASTLGLFPLEWTISAVGDFNFDTKPDIVWSNSNTGERAIWLMDGTQFLGVSSLGIFPAEWTVVASGDFNQPAPASNAEAARFLIQATFGPSLPGITQLRTQTYSQWLDTQIALPASYHLPFYQRRRDENVTQNNGNDGYGVPRQEAWWQMALTAPDQLRQRMAFALSQIFVISQDGVLESANEGSTVYYDILVRNAFGNYRQLLEEVTLSPAMGTYLSMIRNRKPNPQTGTQPDENYAREIMQLFSIGLSQLNEDGTLKLDANGKPIPTYTQADIVGLAHVFTGWGPNFDPANPPRWPYTDVVATEDAWFIFGEDYLHPMSYYPKYADLQTRTIVGGVTVANSLTGPQRLRRALDTLFNHPNVGPFLGRQLIQRFVTSNPSPAYVQRITAVFNNNGVGVRGDLGAVIRAILTDPEARNATALTDARFGKLTEPLLRISRLFRAFPLSPAPQAGPNETRLLFHTLWTLEEQNPLYSPTVFNFFKPGFIQPGLLAANGLISPEFQIFTDVTAIWSANRLYNSLFWGDYIYDVATGNGLEYDPDFSELRNILNTSATAKSSPATRAQLVDTLNERLLGGTMSAFLRQNILDSLEALPYYGDKPSYQNEVITVAVYLAVFSPEFNITR